MKGITLRHPWAFAIAYLGKQVENRDWDDRLADLMGIHDLVGETVAIHGGTAPHRPKRKNVLPTNPWREFTTDLGYIRDNILGGELPDAAAQYLARTCPGPLQPEAFILPGIVAVAVVQGVTRASRDRWAAQGQLHILLDQVVTLPKPVQLSGHQGIWTVPEVIADEVTEQARQVLDTRPQQYAELGGAAWLS
ncbi:hypothetical protein [Deinococcus hopiensis]|uniref:Uncharacterized protein n=1 Tax=Deinococcus hopiensis KR-140 TaxID=695939 RepID=A0A1W1VJ31_9DEIO|nr:hypothetical protein [Deinococcus hopiensis]SMB93372.1 hypothetical protein SAMN00790413_01956 [Deinococcus hopiensis KR-140]